MPEDIVSAFPYKKKSLSKYSYIFRRRCFFENLWSIIKIGWLLIRNGLTNASVCGQDHLPESRIFISFFNKDFEEYEDGRANYFEPERKFKNRFLNAIMLCDYKPCFGWSKNVTRIYLTNPDWPLASKLERKTKWVNLKDEWNSLSLDKQNFLKRLYGIDNLDVSNFEILILTRPYSDTECPIMTEERKIEVVREVIEKYPAGKILIKPHYREKTDYNQYFRKCTVLKGNFPIELMLLAYSTSIKTIICFGECSVDSFIRQHMKNTEYLQINLPEESKWNH
jgi:hypothetical protein